MRLFEATTLQIDELRNWLSSLDPTFVFLLSLPVMVVVAGFVRDAWDRHRARRLAVETPMAKGKSGDSS